ncbi:MAG TPA: MBL fold metallo-hydrolase [Bacilli bacterium]
MIHDDRYCAVTKVSLQNLLRWRRERRSKRKDLSYRVPVAKRPEVEFIRANRGTPALTWIGHSSFLIQIGGLNLLVDPVWAKRMGFAKRLSPPGLPLDAMPAADFVLISHSHYDHLDFPTLRKLSGDPTYLVPLGLGELFRRKGFQQVKEFAWWEQMRRTDIAITFVPARHWSRRTLRDLNKSLWGGWVIHSNGKTIYFVGDSGYHDEFKTIGKRYRIDVVLMPIGAYEPEWFMKNQHVSPEEAVQSYIDLQAEWMVPMHYGAFRLADDTPKEALDRLHQSWAQRGLGPERLKVLAQGETLRF